MPACFTLTKWGETEPSKFAQIDDEMREHFGAPPDAEHYYRAWYEVEGLGLAGGMTWDKLREILPERAAIINWLEENYVAEAWYSRG